MEPILYKKKITTIVNEYYKILDNLMHEDVYKTSPEVYTDDETLGSYPPGQSPQFDSNTFRESVKAYFDSYAKKMEDLILASNASEDELSAAEENLFRDMWTIGTLMRPFYSAEFSEKLTHQFRTFALLEIQIISFIRSGWDIKTWTDRISTFTLNDLGNMLSSYNNNYNREQVRDYWMTITDSWLDAMKARAAKDTTKFNESIGIANRTIKDFAVYLADGVINHKAGMFLPLSPV